MRSKKILSAVCTAAALGTLLCSAAAVNAQDVQLTYLNSSKAPLNSFTYTDASASDTYTLTDSSKALLAKAKSGDTLTITYDLSSNGSARYRAGQNFAGSQFWANCYSATEQGSTYKNGKYYMNIKFVKDDIGYQTAKVTYKITLNDAGTASSITPTLTDGGNNSVTCKEVSVTDGDLTTITLNSDDRKTKSQTFDNDSPTLSNFKAVLSTAEDAAPIINAEEFTDYTPNTEASDYNKVKGYTATVSQSPASMTWYLKKSDTAYKELTSVDTSDLTIENGSATFGLIISGLNDEESVQAGYATTAAEAE